MSTPISTVIIDQDRYRWAGSGSIVSTGSCPFDFYTTDTQFNTECYKSAKWAAERLGYPAVDIEMLDINFYACFEEAVSEYAAQVNQYNIKNNYLSLLNQPTSAPLNGLPVVGSGLPYVINLAEHYGSEVGVGGFIDIKKGSMTAIQGQQTYDLQDLWGDISESFNRIEVRRVFHGPPPAFARIYDPFSMTGMSYSNVLNEMGFAGYSPATQFLMCPIFEDLLRGQAIEFNDMVRKSGYSFEVVNNKIKIFPIPVSSFKIYFEYIVSIDRLAAEMTTTASYQLSSDYSNIPYDNISFTSINAIGRQWIRKYFLALCKEVLGATRGKYATIPIPGGETTLDGAELRSEASAEKETLVTQLREMLDAMNPTAQMESLANRTEKQQDMMRKSMPLLIYIGVFLISLFPVGISSVC
jgi:hypothetical protein